jgi:peroxiredoxin
VEHGVLQKEPYSDRPRRFDYVLTQRGEGLLPVLIAMQEFGDRFVLGDGSVTATAGVESREADRVHSLLGRTLPNATLTAHDGAQVRVAGGAWRVLYFFPGALVPDVAGLPPNWGEIPGAAGCTLESRTYAAHHERFVALGCEVVGLSTQRPDQLEAFADFASLPFTLLSDQDALLASSLRLPMFRAAGVTRYKRQSLLLDPAGVVRHVQMPITDPARSVTEMLAAVASRAEMPE